MALTSESDFPQPSVVIDPGSMAGSLAVSVDAYVNRTSVHTVDERTGWTLLLANLRAGEHYDDHRHGYRITQLGHDGRSTQVRIYAIPQARHAPLPYTPADELPAIPDGYECGGSH